MHQYSYEAYSTSNSVSNCTPKYIRHAQFIPYSTRSNISQYTIRKKGNPYTYNSKKQNQSQSQRWREDTLAIDNEVELMKIRLNCELLSHKINKLNSIVLPKDHQMTNRSLYNLKYTKYTLEDTHRSSGTEGQKVSQRDINRTKPNDKEDFNSDSCNLSDIANDLVDLMDTENKKEQEDYNESGAVPIDIHFGESADGIGDSIDDYVNHSNRKMYAKEEKNNNVTTQIQSIKSQSMTKGRLLSDKLMSQDKENAINHQINIYNENNEGYEEDMAYDTNTVFKSKKGRKVIKDGDDNAFNSIDVNEEDEKSFCQQRDIIKQYEDQSKNKTETKKIMNNAANNDELLQKNKNELLQNAENNNKEIDNNVINDDSIIRKGEKVKEFEKNEDYKEEGEEDKEGETNKKEGEKDKEVKHDKEREKVEKDKQNENQLKNEKRNSNEYNGKVFNDLRKRFNLNDDDEDEDEDEEEQQQEEEEQQEEVEKEEEENQDNNEEAELEENLEEEDINDDCGEQEEDEDESEEECEREDYEEEEINDEGVDVYNNEAPESSPQNNILPEKEVKSHDINKINPAIVNPNITSEDEEEMILSTIISNAKAQEESDKKNPLESIMSQDNSNQQSLQNSNQQSQLNSHQQSQHNSNQPSQQLPNQLSDQIPQITSSPAKRKKTVQFSERELVTINYNEKEKITQLTLFDADGEIIQFKPRNLERYFTLLSSAQPKSIIVSSPTSNKAIALETLNNLLNEEKEEDSKKTIPLSNSKNEMIYGNNEITQRNILKCQEIQNNIKGGAKTFWKIKEKRKAKMVHKHNCKKFEENPQKFFTEHLCLNVLQSYDIKTIPDRTKSCSPSKVKVFTTKEDKKTTTCSQSKNKAQKKKEDKDQPKSFIRNLKEMVENVRIEIINEEKDDNDNSKDNESSNQRKMSC